MTTPSPTTALPAFPPQLTAAVNEINSPFTEYLLSKDKSELFTLWLELAAIIEIIEFPARCSALKQLSLKYKDRTICIMTDLWGKLTSTIQLISAEGIPDEDGIIIDECFDIIENIRLQIHEALSDQWKDYISTRPKQLVVMDTVVADTSWIVEFVTPAAFAIKRLSLQINRISANETLEIVLSTENGCQAFKSFLKSASYWIILDRSRVINYLEFYAAMNSYIAGCEAANHSMDSLEWFYSAENLFRQKIYETFFNSSSPNRLQKIDKKLVEPITACLLDNEHSASAEYLLVLQKWILQYMERYWKKFQTSEWYKRLDAYDRWASEDELVDRVLSTLTPNNYNINSKPCRPLVADAL